MVELALLLVLQSRPEPDWLPVLDAPQRLSHELVLPIPAHAGPRLHIRGTVFKADGKTPAAGVTLYVHHTDARGLYPTPSRAMGWDRWHGTLRGWLRTDAEGRYILRTTRPAPYPGGTEPAHIHVYGLAQGSRQGFFFDDILFRGDPLANEAYWSRVRRFGTQKYEGMRTIRDQNGVLQGQWNLRMPR